MADGSWAQQSSVYSVMLEKGTRGYGIQFTPSERGPTITAIFPKTQAAENGMLQVGDVLLMVDDIETVDKSFEEVVKLIQGSATVKMTFRGRPAAF